MPTEQKAILITTPAGQPNVVEVPSQLHVPARRELMQFQKSFLTSKSFYGFVVAEVGVIGGVLTEWAKGAAMDRAFIVTAVLALGGPVLALYGRIVAQGPLGLSEADTVPAPEH